MIVPKKRLRPTIPPRRHPQFATALPNAAQKPIPHESPPDADWESLMTNREAAVLLRIHPKTLERMARRYRNSSGQHGIPGYFYAGRWFFRRSELDGWLRAAVKSA
jgi:hypothetical protein